MAHDTDDPEVMMVPDLFSIDEFSDVVCELMSLEDPDLYQVYDGMITSLCQMDMPDSSPGQMDMPDSSFGQMDMPDSSFGQMDMPDSSSGQMDMSDSSPVQMDMLDSSPDQMARLDVSSALTDDDPMRFLSFSDPARSISYSDLTLFSSVSDLTCELPGPPDPVEADEFVEMQQHTDEMGLALKDLAKNKKYLPRFKTYDFLDEDLNCPSEPMMCVAVNPLKVSGQFYDSRFADTTWRDIFPYSILKVEHKERKRNNEAGSSSESEASCLDDEVHVDHCYFQKETVKVEVKVEVQDVEPAATRRPVGRPRKCKAPPLKKKKFDDEEIVDVESVQMEKAGRSPPKAKPAAASAPKRRGRKPNSQASVAPSTSYAMPSCSYATPSCSTDSNGFVMRSAKTSAMKKIAKTTKNCTASPRTKRNDHNDMERRRRFEMKQLFDQLKECVEPHLLKDNNGKYKKNPSKNTILMGARLQLEDFLETRLSIRTLFQQKTNLLKRLSKKQKKLRKQGYRI